MMSDLTTPEMGQKLENIFEYYGENKQLLKLLEELTEAQAEVIGCLEEREWRDAEPIIDNMIDELADVAVMTGQFILHYGKKEQFEETFKYKVERTLAHIKSYR